MPDRHPLRRGQDILPEEGCADGEVLCIGDLLLDCRFPPSVRYASGVALISWSALVEKLSMGMDCGTIYSAATSSNFDCVDIAQLLFRSSFRGRYRVVAPEVPNPGLIRREIGAICPGLNFDIDCTPPSWVIRLC